MEFIRTVTDNMSTDLDRGVSTATGEAAMGVMDGNGRVTEARRSMEASLLNPQNFSLNTLMNWPENGIRTEVRDDVRRTLDRVDIFLPVYNQEQTIGRTIDYVTNQHGIPPERITCIDCSEPHDRSGEILRSHGIHPLDQWQVLNDLVDKDRFFELCQVNGFRDLRGKGLTMFAGYLHRFMRHQQGIDKRPYDSHVIQTDTDIGNIGTGPMQWDPLSYFAYFGLRKHPDLHYFKAAKVGRNNEPFYVFNNAVTAFGEHGMNYKQDLSTDIWPLTGEYGYKRQFPEREVVYPSGYPIEMLMNMRRAELKCLWRQVAVPEARKDGQNDWNKEIPMYADIMRMIMVVMQTGKTLDQLSLEDIRAINEKVAKDDITFVHDTMRVTPVDPKPLRVSRLMGSIPLLQREGIIYSGK